MNKTWVICVILLTFAALTSPSAGQEISGTGKGVITRDVSSEGAGLLKAFFFHFTKTDHPLQTISVHQELAKMELAFADRHPSDSDDDYIYQVILQHNSNAGILKRSVSQLAIGNIDFVVKELQDPASRGRFVFVLRGFKFTYADDDFAIKKIGISENLGVIKVDLHDRSGQNKFRVTVDYALVPRELVSTPNAVMEGKGAGPTTIHPLPGVAVLSGFSFEYIDDDFRMMELGVFAQHDAIKLLFNDQSLQRRYFYKVFYTILK
jgi:hypothetical protein